MFNLSPNALFQLIRAFKFHFTSMWVILMRELGVMLGEVRNTALSNILHPAKPILHQAMFHTPTSIIPTPCISLAYSLGLIDRNDTSGSRFNICPIFRDQIGY